MGPAVISALACVLMLTGALIGVQLRRKLPDHHLGENTKDIVRMGAGLVATIVAVVLGLLINSAASTYEAQRGEVRRLAADFILLDHLLETYGPRAQPIRVMLRQGLGQLVDHLWHQGGPGRAPEYGPGSTAANIYSAIHALPATDKMQQESQGRAAQVSLDIAHTRLMLMEQAQTPVPLAIVAILVFWLMALFASFSLFTPVNRAAATALVVIAVSASAALFLFLEMTGAFSGLVQISSRSLSNLLPPLS